MKENSLLGGRLIWVGLFSSAFAFVEATVVLYLRSLYYPDGFVFPLRMMVPGHVAAELVRECSTILMLIAFGALAGVSRWTKFAFFCIAFGLWDLFYYIGLKVLLDWPSSLFDWDILFLIPIPWIGPVIAPVIISMILIGGGVAILRRENTGTTFHPSVAAIAVACVASVVVIVSFMLDTQATLHFALPSPYHYEVFVSGCLLYGLAAVLAFRIPARRKNL